MYRTFFKILIPLLMPAIATIAIFVYLLAWNELMFAITFISHSELKTLAVGIMSLIGQYVTSWGQVGAALLISSLPTILLFVVMGKKVQQTFLAGAVKG